MSELTELTVLQQARKNKKDDILRARDDLAARITIVLDPELRDDSDFGNLDTTLDSLQAEVNALRARTQRSDVRFIARDLPLPLLTSINRREPC
jgi:hypothetical protein